jgi:hypothetical protein
VNGYEYCFAGTHEYTLVYSRNPLSIQMHEFIIDDDEQDDWEQDEYGYFKKGANLKSTGINAPRAKRPNLFFPIFIDANDNIYVTEDDNPPKELDKKKIDILFPVTKGEEMSWRWSKTKINNEKYNIIINKNGELSIYKKQRPSLGELPSKKPKTLFYKPEYSSGNGTAELKKLFTNKIFENPKPIQLIKDIIFISTNKEDIILDAFAGSGTTLHAVMELNNQDEGKRSCIIIQNAETTKAEPQKNTCKDITRERIKRAIDKYNYNSGFRYFKVGIPIDAETMLSGQLPTYKQFAEYVYYLCTGTGLLDKKSIDEKSYYVGTYDRNVIYLLYKQNFEALTKMPLNFDVAEQLIKTNPGKRIIVYAPACFLEDDYMKDHNIDFVGIPYTLFSRVSP